MGNVCTEPPKSSRDIIIEHRNKRRSQLGLDQKNQNTFKAYKNNYSGDQKKNDETNIFKNNNGDRRVQMNETHFKFDKSKNKKKNIFGDDSKKSDMDKTLKNGLSMSEMDPLNHKWLDFAI